MAPEQACEQAQRLVVLPTLTRQHPGEQDRVGGIGVGAEGQADVQLRLAAIALEHREPGERRVGRGGVRIETDGGLETRLRRLRTTVLPLRRPEQDQILRPLRREGARPFELHHGLGHPPRPQQKTPELGQRLVVLRLRAKPFAQGSFRIGVAALAREGGDLVQGRCRLHHRRVPENPKG